MLRTLLILLLVAFLTSPLWIAALAVEPVPLTPQTPPLSIDDVESAKRLLSENDPRRLREGERSVVVASARELELALRYALPQGSAARVGLAEGAVSVTTSIPVPSNPVGDFLNVQVLMVEDDGLLEPTSIRLGRINLPAWAARGAWRMGDRVLKASLPEYRAALDALESIEATNASLAVTYRWRPEVLSQISDRGRDLLLPQAQREAVLFYYASIAETGRGLRPGASLADVLGPLFSRAAERSAAGADAVSENRALLLALGMAIQGANPNRLTAAGDPPVTPLRGFAVTLRGRGDLAQHFVISAALAVGSNSALADAIGVFKELSDSQGGSGFSFPDLLADRAGVRLAERATDKRTARATQIALAGDLDESAFMPPLTQLPEGLQDLEFRDRYGDVDTAAYNRVQGELERRIDTLALYREG